MSEVSEVQIRVLRDQAEAHINRLTKEISERQQAVVQLQGEYIAFSRLLGEMAPLADAEPAE